VEAHEYYTGDGRNVPPGVEVTNQDYGGVHYSKVVITSEEGGQALHKPIGTYITIDAPGIKDGTDEGKDQAAALLARELELLLLANGVKEDDEVLVVGLGNWNVTPDALGPKTISRLMVTRHLFEFMPHVMDKGMRPVCALAPGVLGITGIETGEIVRGVSEKIMPKAIIAIDALASMKTERLGTTLQITDSGINPGSGVGNNRKVLDKATLGIPVIAVGVPTVVDAATIADDAIDIAISKMQEQANPNLQSFNMLKAMNEEDRYTLIHEAIGSGLLNMIVTPKEIDEMIDDIADVIADGINMGLHKGIDMENSAKYLN